MTDQDLSLELEQAVQAGDYDLALKLLSLGADPNASAALHYASKSPAPPLLTLLLRHGGDPNLPGCEGETPLFPAAGRDGSAAAVRELLSAGANPHHRCDDGDTPLMRAAYQRNWWLPDNPLVALLEAGADPNYVNQEGGAVPTTALIWAARQGNDINVDILLARGADPNLPDASGTTPLHAAAAGGHLKIVEQLLAHGACAEPKDGAGWTPGDYLQNCWGLITALLVPPSSRDPGQGSATSQ